MRVLLIRPGAIGDTIVSLPALEFCRGSYTEVWTATQNVPLIRFADRVRSIVSTGLDLLELGCGGPGHKHLRDFDRIVSWYGSTREEFRSAVSDLPFVFHAALPRVPGCHAVDFYLKQVGGTAGTVPVIDAGSVTKRDFVAVHPFSGSPGKNWPMEKFRSMALSLPLPVEFCAGPEEELDGAVRCESLLDLARWLASARAYVGNDSGISHLAAAVGVPVLTIFRATDPAIWAPRGRAAVRVLTGNPPVEDVRAGLLELLETGRDQDRP